MPLRIAVQMDPIDRIDIRGDSTFAILLEAQKRGHDIFYYTPLDLSLREGQASRARPDAESRRQARRALRAFESAHRKSGRPRCRPAAAGPAVRHGLHHDDASARAHPSQDARRQRSGKRAQRAGKTVRPRLPRPDAADARHALARRRAGVPRRVQGHHRQAALRQRRRGRVPHAGRTTAISARSSSFFKPSSASPSWCRNSAPR